MPSITFTADVPTTARIVAAFQLRFPALTNGLADGAAVKAVVLDFIKNVVADSEAEQSYKALKDTRETDRQTAITTIGAGLS